MPPLHAHIFETGRGRRWSRHRLRSQRGQAFIETAIGVVVILGSVWAVIDAGVLFWTYVTLENAVTEATRYAVTQQTITGQSRIDSIKTVLRQYAPGITIADSEVSFQNITDGSADAGGPNDTIRVSVDHIHRPLLPLPFSNFTSGTSGDFRIRVTSTMRNEPP